MSFARCVAAGVRQYVVLGAGLDTFANRNPYRTEGLHVFEVDHPGTQRWKWMRDLSDWPGAVDTKRQSMRQAPDTHCRQAQETT